MAQFLSIALFIATLAVALGVIAAMLRGHADAIAAALAGRSLKVSELENRGGRSLNFLNFQPRHTTRPVVTSRRSAPLRAAA